MMSEANYDQEASNVKFEVNFDSWRLLRSQLW